MSVSFLLDQITVVDHIHIDDTKSYLYFTHLKSHRICKLHNIRKMSKIIVLTIYQQNEFLG